MKKICFQVWVSVFSMIFSAQVFAQEPIPNSAPAPADNTFTPEKVELGKQLYFDKRLSADNSVSCQSCHDVLGNGTDSLPTSKGIHGQIGGRNAPTVWNSAFHSVQFWDGRANTLEDQAKGPITNPIEMGMKDHATCIEKIKTIPAYVDSFKKVFGGENPVTIDNVAKAIATYERTLITPNSPFDQFLKGNTKAMSPLAQKGYKTFQETGCVSCHMGPMFSGPKLPVGSGFYMKFPTFENNAYVKKYGFMKDTGRHSTTKNVADKHFWRVPSLRNVAKTGPYFHTGNVKELDEAVRVMAKVQLNKDLKAPEVKEIVAFLESLTGEFPKQTEPKLP